MSQAKFHNAHITDGPNSINEFKTALLFEHKKYLKYLKILSKKLNEIHDLNKPDHFWESIIGFTLWLHIANCRRVFEYAEKSEQNCDTLRIQKFTTPTDHKVYRNIFKVSDLGDQLLLQQYNKIFNKSIAYIGGNNTNLEIIYSVKNISPKKLFFFKRIKVCVQNIIPVIKRLTTIFISQFVKPEILLIECHWKFESIQNLTLRSFGKISVKPIFSIPEKSKFVEDSYERAFISSLPDDSDRFDQYFFSSLNWSAPCTWIEDFKSRLLSAESYLAKFPKARAIVNETLSEDATMLLAVGREKNIKAIHSEHNYLQQQFLGNITWLHLKRVDKYLTLGWSSNASSKIIPTGSHFNWHITSKKTKTIALLFVGGVASNRMQMTSSGYSFSGNNNAIRYRALTIRFLNSIPPELLSTMYYKDYPIWRREMLGTHPVENDLLSPFISKFKRFDRSDQRSTADLLSCSRLVIVDYLSTPYLQALLSNTPTIIIYDISGYFLTDEKENFYDELIDAQIFHTDPVSCAKFVSQIANNPEIWWNTEKVQTARSNFISSNFGDSSTLDKYLLNLLKEDK